MIDRVRTFIGYREYPKYGMVSRYFVYKRALLARGRAPRAGRRARATPDDIFFLTFDELHEVVRTQPASTTQLIARRRDAFGRTARSRRPACSPPTARPSPAPTGATTCPPARWSACRCPPGPSRAGPASSSTWPTPTSSRATSWSRPHTDPSWSPLFVAIAGLVTEVGGLMTHGAVIAREYGLPAVVGVEHATQLIEDGSGSA